MTKTVIVVEDNSGLREQIVAILRTAPDIRCIGAFSTGEEALAKILVQNPDVVLMDIGLPGVSGIDCVTQLKRINPVPQIIIVTIYEDADRIFRALRAGADGYLLTCGPPQKLLDAVRDVDTGSAQISSPIACKVVEHFKVQPPDGHKKNNISQREQQVLSLLASGFFYEEIGNQLGVSVEAVRSLVRGICQRIQLYDRVEAMAMRQAEVF
jgi:DNA-binding NarL/FixJ family response regulator